MAQATIHQVAKAVLNLSKQLSTDQLAKAVAVYVVTERRTTDLGAIMREIARLRNQSGIMEATITTAVPVTDVVKQEVRRLIGAKDIVINEFIDKNVIGGVRIEANDYYLDLTVRNRLDRLRHGALD